MKIQAKIIFYILMIVSTAVRAQPKESSEYRDFTGRKVEVQNSQWECKKVAFLGDSMTQKGDSANMVYWECLEDFLGIEPFVYGISGHQWDGIYLLSLPSTFVGF